MSNRHGAWAAGLVLAVAGAAESQARQTGASDKSGYDLGSPTPRELLRAMSTDRPDTTESPYTVDAGHWQVEMSFVEYTYDDEASVTTETWSVAPFLIKLGLLNDIDVQIGFEPYNHHKVEDGGSDSTEDGTGDVTLRVKFNLWGNDGGETAGALMPFLTIPTEGDGPSADNLEGGIIAPLAVDMGDGMSLGLMAELDFVQSTDGEETVVDFVHTASLSQEVTERLGVFAEYAGFWNFDDEVDYRAYFNTGVTFAPTPNRQWDGGVRVGLSDAADDIGAFVGVSFRY